MSSISSRPVYRFSNNAMSSQSNEFGNYILKRGAGEIRKPTWNATETVVRILPCWDFDNDQWEPFRRSPDPMDYGDWIRRYDSVKGFGESGVTFLLYDPINDPTYDIQGNPCVLLHKAINSAIDNRTCEPDWPSLLKGGAGKSPLLGRHQPIYIVRCGIFRIKSKDMATVDRSPLGLAPGDQAYFLQLPKTAGEKLISLLEELNEGYEGEPDDYDKAYKYGDIVSLDKGAYVHIYEEGSDPRNNQQQQPGQSRQLTVGTGGRGNYGGGGGGSQFKGYDMFIDKTWNGYAPELNTPELEKLIKSKQKPWADCLQFFSNQEQAFMVQDGFPASAILYAWRDHPEWIKDETRARATGRVSVGVNVPTSQSVNKAMSNFSNAAQTKYAQPKIVEPDANEAVGGWGKTAWSDDGVKDTVVPMSPVMNSPVNGEAAKLSPVTAQREKDAIAALEAAKARAAGRGL